MLNLIRSNQPIAGIVIPVTSILFALIFWFFDYALQPLPETFAWLQSSLHFEGKWWLGILVSTLTAWLFNRTFNRHELNNDPSVLAGAISVFVFGGSLFLAPVSPVLLGAPFYILGLNEVLKVYRENDASDRYFNAGWLFGVASLLSWFYAPFLITTVVCVLYTRAANWKEIMLPIIGFILPVMIFGTLLWIFDQPLTQTQIGVGNGYLEPNLSTLLFSVFTLLLIIIGTLIMFRSFGVSSNKSKNSKAITFFFTLSLLTMSAVGFFQSGALGLTMIYLAAGLSLPYVFRDKKNLGWTLIFYVWFAFGIWMWVAQFWS